MIKVITYGTFDLLHRGHIRLLERARTLGDYLIVGVTSDDYDKARGKLNVKQSLLERIEGVRATGLADEIIVEEYEGQKIDDVRRYGANVFTVGSDWAGKFDYLKEYCEVIYLPRTEGVSSSELRTARGAVRLGLMGDGNILSKYVKECGFVNGLSIAGVCTQKPGTREKMSAQGIYTTPSYEELLDLSDAVYILSHPFQHYDHVRRALLRGRHVLCEPPVAMRSGELAELFQLADKRGLTLMDALKTAYSTAYYRLLLLLKGGCVGEIVSVDVTCTSLSVALNETPRADRVWSSICAWGPQAMLPVFQVLGTNYSERTITTCLIDERSRFDAFTKIDFLYPNAVGTMKVGKGVKSEGELIVSGTKGYIYVPAPWWKTDYFEVRYEQQSENRRCFYPLDGEGIRYELVNFVRSIETKTADAYIERDVTAAITGVIEAFHESEDLRKIQIGNVGR